MTFEAKRLGDIAEIIGGGTPSTKDSSNWDGDIPWITPKDLSSFEGIYVSRGSRSITEKGFKSSSAKMLPAGAVLYTSRAPIGYVAIASNAISTNQGFKSLILKDGYVPEFVFYLLKASKSEIESHSSGGTFAEISAKALSDVVLRFPPKVQQEAIAKLLKSLDEKIAINNTISKTLEDIAQTIFESWFIDFDPVKAKMAGEKPVGMDDATAALFPDSMEESELGLIPEGWQASQLKSMLVLHKTTIKAGTATESVPYVPIDQIGSRDIFLKNSMSGTEAKTSLVSFKKNEILFGAMRPYFHKVVLAPFDGTTRTTTFVLRVINPRYLSFALLTLFQDSAVTYATNHSQGTTIPYAVWSNSFENFSLVIPSEPIATAFNGLVLPLLEYGYSLMKENQKLVQIRDDLLPRLISGELQIPEEMLVS